MRAYGEQDLAEFAAGLNELRATCEPPTESGTFVAYTDGACFGNPRGPGGWAAAVFAGTQAWQLFGHLSSTSNNRAEALGVLGALEWVPSGSRLELHADSELTVRQLAGRYKIKANTDIWSEIQRVRAEHQLEVVPEWVPGHAGEPLNELADRLSKLGARNGTLADLDGFATEVPAAGREPPELVGVVPRGDWERDFVRSVRDQLRRGRSLSPKQQAVVDRIRARSASA
ncbi:MAG TPA: RNase H family protein [Chloroflexota bacterium]